MHLGLGAFHRAHQAVYVDDLLGADPNWGITGASLHNAEVPQSLTAQNGLYTLAVRGGATTEFRIVGSVREALHLETQREKLMARLTAEDTRIVSLTITEKGYCHDPATGELNLSHPDIAHDLALPDAPRSAPGLIVVALAARRALGFSAFTVLCCDNLPENGVTARKVIVGFAHRLDSVIGNWIKNETRFPSTMVDRIVPATTETDRAEISGVLGLDDAAPVVAEPFTQWVIEDNFGFGRPRFEDAGAQMVGDVRPHELMKLRMLNGSHSALAYLGYLMGYETIAEAVNDSNLSALIRKQMTEEMMPTLAVPGTDLGAYRDTLMRRFANPALRHRTSQVAMDGSQKLPQRLLAPIRENLAAGRPFATSALTVAAWMRYVTGLDERGKHIAVSDPLAQRLGAIFAETGRDVDRLATRYASATEMFGKDLGTNHAFVAKVGEHLQSLFDFGARETVRRYLSAAQGGK